MKDGNVRPIVVGVHCDIRYCVFKYHVEEHYDQPTSPI